MSYGVSDIYVLHQKYDKLLSLEGFGEKKADSLLDSIDQSRYQSLARLITSLGIHGVGNTIAEILATHYPSLMPLALATTDDLESIEGIGRSVAQSIREWFSSVYNQGIVCDLWDAGIGVCTKPHIPIKDDLPLLDLVFVITGTLPTMSRDQVKSLIEDSGGKVTNSVSSKTNYLVMGENPGGKLTKAQSLGVDIITEEQLRQML